MEELQSRLHAGDRVRIREWVEPGLYNGLSTLHNEGVIKAVEADKFGLPKVFIEWDKNHWSYNGAPDGWTFEDHFDIISTKKEKQSMSDLTPEQKAKFKALMAEIMSEEPSSAQPEEEAPVPSLIESEGDDHDKRLAEAHQMIEDSESFVVIAVQKHPVGGQSALVPRITRWDGNPIASLVGSVFMSDLASQQYKELVLDALESIQG